MNSPSNNLFIGKVSQMLEEIDSTNEYAKQLVSKSKPPDGAVIIARKQTGGKGQIGKKWESEPGKNLTISVILYPAFLEVKKAFLLNQAVGLALKGFFESLHVPVRIKWPNDIYFHDKKLAGILIENGLLGERLSYSIIGIGLNVNQTSFSAEIPNPVSLKLIAGREFDLDEVLSGVCEFMEILYLQLKAGHITQIKREYESCLFRLDERGFYKTMQGTFEGIIRGVDDEGRLLMEMNGKQLVFGSNELLYL